ncbi:hypothetical protein [Microvirga thermotolerans]|nr:hypothetical protein [Microvirga thermotolerans]
MTALTPVPGFGRDRRQVELPRQPRDHASRQCDPLALNRLDPLLPLTLP